MKRPVLILLALLLGALALVSVPGASAGLSGRIEGTRERIEHSHAREGVLTGSIAAYSTRIERLEGEIGGIQAREGRIQTRLEQKRAELAAVRIRLDGARETLTRLREQLAVAERALAKRLVELYKADEPDALTVVLEADGFADLLERTEFLELVSAQDREVVARVRVLRGRAAAETRRLGGLEAQAEAAAAEIARRRDELAQARRRLDGARAELVSARGIRRSALARVRAGRAKLEGDLRAMQAQQARVAAALRASEADQTGGGGAGPVRRGSGRLIWPVGGPLVSPFGPRWGRLHAGVDISAPAGTAIRAADSGRVALLGPTGGYGNYVCIQHTASLSTCYAHLSSFGTSSGASVRQGQVIGRVGCTGQCFGDHLHFETRVAGSPVDPMSYL